MPPACLRWRRLARPAGSVSAPAAAAMMLAAPKYAGDNGVTQTHKNV
jgi:hypothetical protein